MFLKVLAPFLGFGHNEEATSLSGKFVDEVLIHMFCGLVFEVGLDSGIRRLDLGVG